MAFVVQIASDIHLEFYELPQKPTDFLVPSAPNLALLGDICVVGAEKHFEVYKTFLLECCGLWERVFVLPGNHEFYSKVSGSAMQDLHRQMSEFCAQHERLVFMDKNAVEVDGVLVVGATLWTHAPTEQRGAPVAQELEVKVSDYRLIKTAPTPAGEAVPLRVADTNKLHAECVQFIEAQVRAATARQQNCFVMTHHAPTMVCLPPCDLTEGSQLMVFNEATNLAHLLDHTANAKSGADGSPFAGVHTWAFGHTHKSCDFLCGHTRVVSNQRGYPFERTQTTEFQNNKTLHIPTAWTAVNERPFKQLPDEDTVHLVKRLAWRAWALIRQQTQQTTAANAPFHAVCIVLSSHSPVKGNLEMAQLFLNAVNAEEQHFWADTESEGIKGVCANGFGKAVVSVSGNAAIRSRVQQRVVPNDKGMAVLTCVPAAATTVDCRQWASAIATPLIAAAGSSLVSAVDATPEGSATWAHVHAPGSFKSSAALHAATTGCNYLTERNFRWVVLELPEKQNQCPMS